MTKLTEEEIKFYESKGFNRWTKGNYDRLYFNMETILDVDRYKTGNISYAELNGEEISHRWAGELLAAKVWIEVSDGSLNVKAGSKDQRTEVGKVVQDYLDKIQAESEEENTEENTTYNVVNTADDGSDAFAVKFDDKAEAEKYLHTEQYNFRERTLLTEEQFLADWSKPADAYAGEEDASQDDYVWDDGFERWLEIPIKNA